MTCLRDYRAQNGRDCISKKLWPTKEKKKFVNLIYNHNHVQRVSSSKINKKLQWNLTMILYLRYGILGLNIFLYKNKSWLFFFFEFVVGFFFYGVIWRCTQIARGWKLIGSFKSFKFVIFACLDYHYNIIVLK